MKLEITNPNDSSVDFRSPAHRLWRGWVVHYTEDVVLTQTNKITIFTMLETSKQNIKSKLKALRQSLKGESAVKKAVIQKRIDALEIQLKANDRDVYIKK